MAKERDDLFDEDNEVKPTFNTLKFGEVGDYIRGTLISNSRTMVNNLSPKKELQTVFEIRASSGEFHNIIKKKVQKEVTVIEEGDVWSYITSNPIMLKGLGEIKIGQIVGLKFAEIKEAKQSGWDNAKIVRIYAGKMDPKYKGEF